VTQAFGKTLFLDFDGVLHRQEATVSQFLSLMPALRACIEPYPVQIVISSDWRLQNSFERLADSFPASLRPRVVAVTGPNEDGPYGRWKEIQAFCKAKGVRDWRALDVHAEGFPRSCQELILCNRLHGLQRTQTEALESWLKT